MKISEYLELMDRCREDAEYYKVYSIKTSGSHAEHLHSRYLEISRQLDKLQDGFLNININITEEDFKC